MLSFSPSQEQMLREGMSGPFYQMHPLTSLRSSPSFYCTPPPVLNSLLILTLSHKHLPRVESLVSPNTLSQSISKNDFSPSPSCFRVTSPVLPSLLSLVSSQVHLPSMTLWYHISNKASDISKIFS